MVFLAFSETLFQRHTWSCSSMSLSSRLCSRLCRTMGRTDVGGAVAISRCKGAGWFSVLPLRLTHCFVLSKFLHPCLLSSISYKMSVMTAPRCCQHHRVFWSWAEQVHVKHSQHFLAASKSVSLLLLLLLQFSIAEVNAITVGLLQDL